MARFGIYVRLFALTFGEAACAQPSLNIFLEKWVLAVQHKDPVAYRALIHPASKACLIGSNEDFLARHIQTRLSTSIETVPQISLVVLVRQDANDVFTYAVKPTHVAALNLGPQTIGLGVLGKLDHWFEVLPCPNGNGLKILRQQWSMADSTAPYATMNYFPHNNSLR